MMTIEQIIDELVRILKPHDEDFCLIYQAYSNDWAADAIALNSAVSVAETGGECSVVGSTAHEALERLLAEVQNYVW